MIEYLYANGCSWTHGNGIPEDPIFRGNTSSFIKTLEFAWPAHLGRLLNVQVNNDAWGGGSNSRILRRTVEFVENYKQEKEKLLVVIGWTTPERDEIYVDEYKEWKNYNAAQIFSDQFINRSITNEQKKLNNQIDKIQKKYVTWIHNHHADIEKYFLQVYLLKNFLENNKVKYLFFNALPWTWAPINEVTAQLPKYNSFAADNFIGPGTSETMMSFCTDNQLPLSSCIHPMVRGHKSWANRLRMQLQVAYSI